MVDLVQVLTVDLPVDGGVPDRGVPDRGVPDRGASWALSGAMALTGRRDGPPLLGPAAAAPMMDALAARLAALSTACGRAVVTDGAALLGERAAIAGHSRQGPVSCGGACRMLRAAGRMDRGVAAARRRRRRTARRGCNARQLPAMPRSRPRSPPVRWRISWSAAAWLGLACSALGEERVQCAAGAPPR